MIEKSLCRMPTGKMEARPKPPLSLVCRNTNITLGIKTFRIQWKKRRGWKSYPGQWKASQGLLHLSWVLHDNEEVFACWTGKATWACPMHMQDTGVHQSMGQEAKREQIWRDAWKDARRATLISEKLHFCCESCPDTLQITMLLSVLIQIQVTSSGRHSLTFRNNRGLYHSLYPALPYFFQLSFYKTTMLCLLSAPPHQTVESLRVRMLSVMCTVLPSASGTHAKHPTSVFEWISVRMLWPPSWRFVPSIGLGHRDKGDFLRLRPGRKIRIHFLPIMDINNLFCFVLFCLRF